MVHSSSSKPSYVSTDEVADKVLSGEEDWLVIDVRTSDFPGGNVPRALNLPSRLFSSPSSVSSLIKKHILPRHTTAPLSKVVVHCMRSQWRGPMAARELLGNELWPEGLEVAIMAEGWSAWRKKYRGRPELIEDLEREVRVRDEEEEAHSVELRTRAEREQQGEGGLEPDWGWGTPGNVASFR